jgi:hypothetical protein
VSVFDDGTEELVAEHPTHGIDISAVRRVWKLPPSSMPGELQIGDEQRGFVDAHLDAALDLGEWQSAFLGLTTDDPGEVMTE